MPELDGVVADELREALADTDDPKAVKRLMVALSYVDDVPVTTLSERYGIPASTVYSWLSRLEDRPLPEALHDEQRPGRPPKLNADQRAALSNRLETPPEGGERWTPERVRDYVDRTFGVSYSVGHARRLLDEFGPG